MFVCAAAFCFRSSCAHDTHKSKTNIKTSSCSIKPACALSPLGITTFCDPLWVSSAPPQHTSTTCKCKLPRRATWLQFHCPCTSYFLSLFFPQDLVYKDGVLVAGSLDALIDLLIPTPSSSPERSYVFAFVLCSRLFLRPHELLGHVTRVSLDPA